MRSKYDLSPKIASSNSEHEFVSILSVSAGAAEIAGGGGRDGPHVPVFKTIGRGEGEY